MMKEANPYVGLTAADVPAAITPEASNVSCLEHPDGRWIFGFGYAGGGFGPYKVCTSDACHKVFAKTSAKDGNE